MKNSRRWFWFTLMGIAFLLCGMAGINYLMDPFSKREGHFVNYDRSAVNRDFNVPLWSVFSVGRLPAESLRESEVIILGDSRATLLTLGEENFRFREIGGKKILNLSLGGGSLKENLSFFHAEEKRVGGFSKLEVVIFTTPFNRICEDERPDRIEQSLPMRGNELLYYFSGYTMKRSLLSIGKIGKPTDQVVKQLTEADGEKALKSWVRTYLGYDEDIANTRYAVMEDFASELGGRGVELIFYMPPGGGSGRAMVSEMGLLDEYDFFLTRMSELGSLENWAEIDGVNGDLFQYKVGDPIHHDKGTMVLGKMIENRADE